MASPEKAPVANDGDWKPTAWFMGEESAQRLLATCIADVEDTRAVYISGVTRYRIKRRTGKGLVRTWALPNRKFATVADVAAQARTNPPDQSWMTNPPDIFGGISWIQQYYPEMQK